MIGICANEKSRWKNKMAKQSELYGMGYKKGIQDCWKEVLKYIKKANDFGVIKFEDISIMTLHYYLTMQFGVELKKEVLDCE